MFELVRMTFARIWRAFRPTQKMWHKVPRLLTHGNSEMFFVVFWATRLVEFRYTATKIRSRKLINCMWKRILWELEVRGWDKMWITEKKSMRIVKEGREGGRRQRERIGPVYLLPAIKISILKYYVHSYIYWVLAAYWTPDMRLHFNYLQRHVWLLCPRMEGNMTI